MAPGWLKLPLFQSGKLQIKTLLGIKNAKGKRGGLLSVRKIGHQDGYFNSLTAVAAAECTTSNRMAGNGPIK